MTTREIRAALRRETHVILWYPNCTFGHRVFDARTKDGKQQVRISYSEGGWVNVHDGKVYEA